MSGKSSRGQKQPLDHSFQGLSISSQQTPPEMLQYQQYYPKNTSSQRTYSTNGSKHGGQRGARSHHNHQGHGHHEPYQHGAMPFPRAPVSSANDDYSDSGESGDSARTVIPPDHQTHAKLSHERMKHSGGAPSDRHSNYGGQRVAREPSVAPPSYCKVEGAPHSYRGSGDGASEAGFAHGMVPDKGIPAPKAYGSEHERSECNNSDPDWITESDSGPVCTEPGVSQNDIYLGAFYDGYDCGFEDGFKNGFKKAQNPQEDNITYSRQCRTRRY